MDVLHSVFSPFTAILTLLENLYAFVLFHENRFVSLPTCLDVFISKCVSM